MKQKHTSVAKCASCGAEIDDDVFPMYCLDCIHVLKTQGYLPNGAKCQDVFNGDD